MFIFVYRNTFNDNINFIFPTKYYEDYHNIILSIRPYLYRLVPAQDVHFFYTLSRLSALQNCALVFLTDFQFIFTFKNALHNLVIELCRTLKYYKSIPQFFSNFTRSFVAIELLTFFKNANFHFYCSIELSLFGLNKLYSLSKKMEHKNKYFWWFIKTNCLTFSIFWYFS